MQGIGGRGESGVNFALTINQPAERVFGPLGNGSIRLEGDCSGNELIRAPEFTYNLGLNYELPTQSGLFGLSTTLAYNGGFYWEPDNRVKEGSYNIFNASFYWTSANGKYHIRVYGKNLLDEEYSIYTTESSFGDTASPAPPHTYGASFELRL